MPAFFSELKSWGGTILMLHPYSEKWGDASPPIDARGDDYCEELSKISFNILK